MSDVYPPEFGPRETAAISQEEIDAIKKTLVAKRVMVFVGCVVLAVLVVSMVLGIWLVRSTQTSSHPAVVSGAQAAKAAEQGTRQIIDCTTPGRRCYDRGQARLAQTVAGLTDSNRRAAAAAASCAHELPDPTFRLVYRCMLVNLASPHHR